MSDDGLAAFLAEVARLQRALDDSFVATEGALAQAGAAVRGELRERLDDEAMRRADLQYEMHAALKRLLLHEGMYHRATDVQRADAEHVQELPMSMRARTLRKLRAVMQRRVDEAAARAPKTPFEAARTAAATRKLQGGIAAIDEALATLRLEGDDDGVVAAAPPPVLQPPTAPSTASRSLSPLHEREVRALHEHFGLAAATTTTPPPPPQQQQQQQAPPTLFAASASPPRGAAPSPLRALVDKLVHDLTNTATPATAAAATASHDDDGADALVPRTPPTAPAQQPLMATLGAQFGQWLQARSPSKPPAPANDENAATDAPSPQRAPYVRAKKAAHESPRAGQASSGMPPNHADLTASFKLGIDARPLGARPQQQQQQQPLQRATNRRLDMLPTQTQLH